MECSCAEEDLTSTVFCLSTRGSDTDACRASSSEDDPVHKRIPQDSEVSATAHNLKITVIRRHAPACAAVHGIRGDSCALGRVMVFCPRIAQVQRRCTEGAVEGPPLFDGGSVHRDGSPARMVRRLGEVEIILKASKAWKHKGP